MAFAKRGKLTTKRLIWDFRSEAKSQLSNWFTDQNNVWSFDALTGYLANGFDYIPEKDRATTPLVNGVRALRPRQQHQGFRAGRAGEHLRQRTAHEHGRH